VPALDLSDDTFIAAHPAEVAAAVHDRGQWVRWWPDLALTVSRDRGAKGVQWVVRSVAPDGAAARRAVSWVGSMEIWLEPWGDGTIVHHYLRLDPGRRLAPTAVARTKVARVRDWKLAVHHLKDELERHRICGEPVKMGAVPADTPGHG